MRFFNFYIAIFKVACFSFFFFLFSFKGNSQGGIYYLGYNTTDDVVYSVLQSSDGGYIMSGKSFGLTNSGTDATNSFISKINSNGSSITWQTNFGANVAGSDDIVYSAAKNTDGGYATAGQFAANSVYNFYAVNFNSTGTKQWTISEQGTYASRARSIIQTNDGGYAIAGTSASYLNATYNQFYIVKTNSSGTLDWKRAIGHSSTAGNPSSEAFAVIQNSNSTYTLVGYTGTVFTYGGYDIMVMNLSSNGSTVNWCKKIGTSNDEYAFNAIKDTDGNIVLVGARSPAANSDWFNSTDLDAVIVKIASDGSSILAQNKINVGADWDVFNSLVQADDGNYVAAGYTYSSGTSYGNPYVVKFNKTTLAVSWGKLYDVGLDGSEAFSIIQAQDKSFVVGGTAGPFPNGMDGLLLVVNSAGTFGAGCNTTTNYTTSASPGFSISNLSASSPSNSGNIVTTSYNTWAGGLARLSTCGSIVAMPIDLISFTGKTSYEQVILNWQSAVEINNDHFTVERSSDGINWNAIGIVKGAGNSSATLNYEFVDESPAQISDPASPIYYRLKQTDYDSRFEYFGPISVLLTSSDEWNLIIKNPVLDELSGTLIVTEDEELILDIIDLQGRIITKERINALKGSNLLKIELKNIEKGIYFLKAHAKKSNRQLIARFVKM